MKENILVYINRGCTADTVKSLLSSIRILDTVSKKYNIYILTNNKTARTFNYIKEVINIPDAKFIISKELIDQREFYYKNNRSFNDVLSELNISSLQSYNFKKIFIFGGNIPHISKDCVMTRKATAWRTVFRSMFFYLCCLKLSNVDNIEFNEICFDPTDYSYSDIKDSLSFSLSQVNEYFGYNYKHYKRLDNIQYYLDNDSYINELSVNDKTLDFCFGYTVMTKERLNSLSGLHDTINFITANLDNNEIYVHSKFDKTNSSISRDDYLLRLSKSKYTLMISPYDSKSFSWIRFLDAIKLNVIPIIDNNVEINDFNNSFNCDISKLYLKNIDLHDYENNLKLLQQYKHLLNFEKGLE